MGKLKNHFLEQIEVEFDEVKTSPLDEVFAAFGRAFNPGRTTIETTKKSLHGTAGEQSNNFNLLGSTEPSNNSDEYERF